MTAKPLRAFLRHLLAWGGTTLVWLLVWTGTYLLLLFWALLADAGIGSPLVYHETLLGLFLLLAVPMGLYWWASQFPSLLHSAFQRIWKRLRP